MEAQVVWACENVRAEWIDGYKCVVKTLLIGLLYVSNLLNCLDKWLHLTAILFYRCVCIRHTEHFQTFGLIGLLVRDLVLLTEYELLI